MYRHDRYERPEVIGGAVQSQTRGADLSSARMAGACPKDEPIDYAVGRSHALILKSESHRVTASTNADAVRGMQMDQALQGAMQQRQIDMIRTVGAFNLIEPRQLMYWDGLAGKALNTHENREARICETEHFEQMGVYVRHGWM